MVTTARLYSYDFKTARTYLFAVIFIAANLIFPKLFHSVPNGGPTFLPIYFFTLIAAYKYGLRVGLLTAVLSPVLNSVLFGMPMLAILPIILIKSSLLAISASLAANYFKKVSFLSLAIIILAYQIVGTGIEWIMLGDFQLAVQDFRIGFPGMLLQLFGGYLLLKAISRL
ncbi:MAG: ECF transporter S component [Paludibacteraceae bacterium]|nr:ECF transporter S component [Paludibacteraceae bacterium]